MELRSERSILVLFPANRSGVREAVHCRLHEKRPEGCRFVFTDIAHVRISAELGNIAKDYIENSDRKTAANATYIFKWVGSADVEPLLWKNLETWHKKWSGMSGPIPFDEQDYEDSLTEALLLGSGPCRSKEMIERLRPIYIKGNSVDGNIEFPEWHDPVRILADPSLPSGPRFQVDFCSGFLDVEQLKSAIPHFPAGSRFAWSRMYLQTPDAALDPLFKEFESLAKEHGMSLQLDQGQ
jgi:hypothetical protein